MKILLADFKNECGTWSMKILLGENFAWLFWEYWTSSMKILLGENFAWLFWECWTSSMKILQICYFGIIAGEELQKSKFFRINLIGFGIKILILADKPFLRIHLLKWQKTISFWHQGKNLILKSKLNHSIKK